MYEAIQDKNGAKDELDRVMEKYDRYYLNDIDLKVKRFLLFFLF